VSKTGRGPGFEPGGLFPHSVSSTEATVPISCDMLDITSRAQLRQGSKGEKTRVSTP
jgi:hypothetical protein